MQAYSHHFKETHSLQLTDCVTSIDVSPNFIAAGCLDDNLYIWQTNLGNINKQPKFMHGSSSMGIIDVTFHKKSSYLSASHIDSTLKIYDLSTFKHSSIQCSFMQNWKIQFVDQTLVTSGHQGKISYFDICTKQASKQILAGKRCLTALAKSNSQSLLATANQDGQLYIVKNEGKNQMVRLKPHHKKIRQLAFSNCEKKVLTACDDDSIKVVDLQTHKITSVLEGHRQSVSSIAPQQTNQNIFFSSSFDKTVKGWDIRTKKHIGSALSGSLLWDVKSIGKYVLTGGDNGLLQIYSFE